MIFYDTFLVKTSTSTTAKLEKDEKGKNIDIKVYKGMVESLLYLTASRPDIMFSVCACVLNFKHVIKNHTYM